MSAPVSSLMIVLTERTCWAVLGSAGQCWPVQAQMITNNKSNPNCCRSGVSRGTTRPRPVSPLTTTSPHLNTICSRKLKCHQTLHLDSGIITSTSGSHTNHPATFGNGPSSFPIIFSGIQIFHAHNI